jgi:hypothetical protein
MSAMREWQGGEPEKLIPALKAFGIVRPSPSLRGPHAGSGGEAGKRGASLRG